MSHDDQNPPAGAGRHPGLESLFSYPLMSAITERRTRRVARGVSLDAGELSHQSSNAPAPIEPLEEAILVMSAAGITGITQHDGPFRKKSGRDELGTPFLNIMARSASSADNAQAVSFFLINDDGIFLVKAPEGRAASEMLKDLPPRWADWSESDWLAAADQVKVRVGDRRLDFPRDWPYYLGWNAQHSNVPGSSVFFPVVDCTRQYINALMILATDGMFFVDDWQRFRPRSLVEIAAWIGGTLGLSEPIPYHVIGGLDRIRKGILRKDSPGPLGFGNTLRTDYGCFFHMQNLMLIGQGLGLGGWVHGSVFPPYIWQRDEAKGWYGLGFRMEEPKHLSRVPPVPASQANPVGIDGVLESLSPPYVSSMRDAVEQVLEKKYGDTSGGYGDLSVFGRSYQRRSDAEAFSRVATRYRKEVVDYVTEVCDYIVDQYGRFPAHVDAFYTPGVWLQFSHLELEYYQKYFDPGLYTRQAQHDAIWHGAGGR